MLKDIDADVLKLDMKFLDLNPENNDKGVSIITAVLDMARQLDIPAIAEGIETDEQLKLLELLGCEYAQGYYYYRPMPISDYEKLVSEMLKHLVWIGKISICHRILRMNYSHINIFVYIFFNTA